MGRFENIYPGIDGIVRVVDVQTKIGVYRRPVMKIHPLEEQTFDEIPQGGRECYRKKLRIWRMK